MIDVMICYMIVNIISDVIIYTMGKRAKLKQDKQRKQIKEQKKKEDYETYLKERINTLKDELTEINPIYERLPDMNNEYHTSSGGLLYETTKHIDCFDSVPSFLRFEDSKGRPIKFF